MNVHTNSKRGFTLIEVILVLAIAALIFLMIFIALPALQASQRDTARKNDVSIVSSAVTKYTSGERKPIVAGGASATTDAALQAYVDKLDQYETTDVHVKAVADGNPGATDIFVYANAHCNGSGVATDTNKRKAAVRIQLDKAGTFYCVDAS
ncbi:MAG TPA: type II secretion system protein [Patescibacteria group bacterium]|jgi:prepilin-type N-terminal cleavage/methylation domain-containing protein|nr:type II secretion system protein [Patescibacteria group bacterium]